MADLRCGPSPVCACVPRSEQVPSPRVRHWYAASVAEVPRMYSRRLLAQRRQIVASSKTGNSMRKRDILLRLIIALPFAAILLPLVAVLLIPAALLLIPAVAVVVVAALVAL